MSDPAPTEIREATADDEPAIVGLLAGAMGRAPDPRFAALLRWKHQDNPFGPSPAWVAVDGTRVLGYRAFLRWQFHDGDETRTAVRAVDTATHPDTQGRGIFRALTMHGLEALRHEGVEFVFNTPNDSSRPGYLKMGWQPVGRLRPRLRPRSLASLPAIVRGRVPAGHWGEPCSVGGRAEDVLADDGAVEALLRASSGAGDQLRTVRSPSYLRWRYDADLLGYRVLTLGADIAEGIACFRVRRRGPALEATVGDLLVPDASTGLRRRLLREILGQTRADYALVLGGGPADRTIPVPGPGPTLVWRSVADAVPPALSRWSLTMGDVELF